MSSEIFRDRTEGATARRQDLLRRRRDEFVMMPHAIRRVFVARRARIAASLAICATGAVFVTTALSASFAKAIASHMPGINPAVLSTFVVAMWVIGALAFTLSRARGEHQFAVQMSKYVLPGEDLDHDLERLSHENPDDIARGMAHRLEVKSAALPLLAAGFILPMTALYIYQGIRAGGWPSITDYEASLVLHTKAFVGTAIAGVVSAVIMTRRFARLPAVAPVGAALALGLGIFAIEGTTWLAGIALLFATAAAIAWRLRKERRLLETEDPAAGSELFTIRGMLRSIASAARTVRKHAFATQHRRIFVWGTTALLVLFGFTMAQVRGDRNMPNKAAARVAPQVDLKTPVVMKSGSTYRIEHMGDGRLKISMTIVDSQPVDIAFPGVATIPPTWAAKLDVHITQYASSLRVTAFPDEDGARVETLSAAQVDATFSQAACDIAMHDLALQVQTQVPGEYTLYVTPVLAPAGC
ncbi:MAG: hypothetical protein HOV81_02900 [Kofleriaceae bacterium]|nr:hypothetical protein [Kofleriaceae bacterium]